MAFKPGSWKMAGNPGVIDGSVAERNPKGDNIVSTQEIPNFLPLIGLLVLLHR
jgi:hypothetical protein